MKISWKIDTKMKDKEFMAKLRKEFNNVMVGMWRDATRLATVDTGFLRQNIDLNKLGDLHYELISRAPYSAAVEYGSKPHLIKAVKAQALHWKKGGEDFFAKSVQHPGTNAQPFMRPALDMARAKMNRLMK